ncbi:MAG: hypothetical protein ABIG08_01250 [bacterium]
MTNNQQTKVLTPRAYPLLNTKERLLLWKKMKGMWKHRQPDPNRELKQIRKEWERNLPSLSR